MLVLINDDGKITNGFPGVRVLVSAIFTHRWEQPFDQIEEIVPDPRRDG